MRRKIVIVVILIYFNSNVSKFLALACHTKIKTKKLITIENLISNSDCNNEISRFFTKPNEIDTKNIFLLKFTDKVKTT